MSRSNRLERDAKATQVEQSYLDGDRPFLHVQLIETMVFLLHVADVVANPSGFAIN